MIPVFKAYDVYIPDDQNLVYSVYVDLGIGKYWNLDVIPLPGAITPVTYLSKGFIETPDKRLPHNAVDVTKVDLNTILEQFIIDLDDSDKSDRIFELLDMDPESRTDKDWEDLITMSLEQIDPTQVYDSFVRECDRIFQLHLIRLE